MSLNTSSAAKTAVDEYLTFCEGFRRISGLDLTQYKRAQMERRIRTFIERRGHKGLSPYLQLIRSNPVELEAFLDRVTINVSELWRHPDQFKTLAKHVLPDLATAGRIRIWSAGSSYGAEAYSLAAVARATVPNASITVTGTDIDKRMVERARRGVFSREDARGVAAADLKRWFEPHEELGLRAIEELRRIARFEVGDLLRMRPKTGAFDLVVCRNTAIYFSEDVRNQLHARLAQAVRPGGYLLVGATERIADPRGCDLTPVHPFTYRKA